MKNGILAEEIVPSAFPRKPSLKTNTRALTPPSKSSPALKPVVKPTGTVTAGNASGVNDGACALLIASEDAVKKFELTPKARIVCAAAAGVPPRIMGMGPVPASRKALALANLQIAAMDVIELNEAFAAQGLAVLRELGIAG